MSDIDARQALELDPFAYFRGAASKIRPFGGTGNCPEPGYGFHTHYVRCAPGHCVFSVELDGLTASNGLLYLQVHMLSNAPGAHAKVATVERLDLVELARCGGQASVRFESLKGMIYALFGRIPETTDATAATIRVRLDRPGNASDEYPSDLIPTELGKGASRAADQLLSLDPPRFAAPVSQICTEQQIREEGFVRWCNALGTAPSFSVPLWETYFVIQALDCYGLISRDAEGLALGNIDVPDVPIAAELVRRGCRIVLSDHATDMAPETSKAEWWQTLLQGANITLEERARIRMVSRSLPAPQPELGQFDFLWSRALAMTLGSVQAVHEMVVESMMLLRPGGVAVHMLRIREEEAAPGVRPADGISLLRAEIQRLALDLVSQNHVVAQLKFAGGSGMADDQVAAGTSGFGLIVRRS